MNEKQGHKPLSPLLSVSTRRVRKGSHRNGNGMTAGTKMQTAHPGRPSRLPMASSQRMTRPTNRHDHHHCQQDSLDARDSPIDNAYVTTPGCNHHSDRTTRALNSTAASHCPQGGWEVLTAPMSDRDDRERRWRRAGANAPRARIFFSLVKPPAERRTNGPPPPPLTSNDEPRGSKGPASPMTNKMMTITTTQG